MKISLFRSPGQAGPLSAAGQPAGGGAEEQPAATETLRQESWGHGPVGTFTSSTVFNCLPDLYWYSDLNPGSSQIGKYQQKGAWLGCIYFFQHRYLNKNKWYNSSGQNNRADKIIARRFYRCCCFETMNRSKFFFNVLDKWDQGLSKNVIKSLHTIHLLIFERTWKIQIFRKK